MITNEDSLLNADPGLPRRFAKQLKLPTYSAPELTEICRLVAQKNFSLAFAAGLDGPLAQLITTHHGDKMENHNGGLSVTLVEQAFRRLAKRIVVQGLKGDDTTTLTIEDFEDPHQESPAREESAQTVTAATPPPQTFDELLITLGLSKHSATLQAQDITAASDLQELSREDMVELGFTIGQRNRVARWALAEEALQEGLAFQLKELARRVGTLD